MTTSVHNISGNDLYVPAVGVKVLAGDTYGFPDDVAAGLLLQTANWAPGGSPTNVSIQIALQGQTNMTVRISGAAQLYTNTGRSIPATFPVTISTDTTFYATVYGTVTLAVSVKDSLGYEHWQNATAVLDPANPATVVTVPLPPGNNAYDPLGAAAGLALVLGG